MKRWLKSLIFYGLLMLSVIGVIIISHSQVDSQPTVVQIKVDGAYNYGDNSWQGSGVFIEDDLILTAGHMVEDANTITIVWPNGKEHKAVSWYQETEADLGIIYIRTPEKEPKARFDNAILGEDCWAIGNPYGVFPILAKGIVSGVNVPDSYSHQKNMVVTDCPLNPGNSGCPVFNKQDEIIGICSWHIPPAEGMNYLVDSDICQACIYKYKAIKAMEQLE